MQPVVEVAVDVVEFRSADEDLGIGRRTTLTPWVNGEPLTALLERSRGGRRGRSRRELLPGGSAGLVGDEVRWPSRHFLGEPVLASFDDDTALLGCGCGCGDYGCGPFSAVVQVDDDVVTWSRYRFADRDVFFTDLRDLVVERRAYEAAVRATQVGAGSAVDRHRGHRRVR